MKILIILIISALIAMLILFLALALEDRNKDEVYLSSFLLQLK